MTDVVVALDIGGTKAHLVVETLDRRRLIDKRLPSQDWDAEPVEKGAAWLVGKLRDELDADWRVAALAIGAQGIDSDATADRLAAELGKQGLRAILVNDASLIVPASGFTEGIGIIAGTGAIGVGRDLAGRALSAGGWGAVIGDEGGAAALVREAVRAALRAHDEGKPADGLLPSLIASFGVVDAERLARKVNDEPTTENWAPHCPVIFAAAEHGSHLAASVITEGGQALATLVGQLIGRGAVGADVIVAGSVVLRQEHLFVAFRDAVSKRHPELRVHRLTVEPVEGAVLLARKAIGRGA